MRLVTATEMQEMDRLAIEEVGIPGVVLMENAARGATRIFLDHFQPLRGAHMVLLCGRGNNGGDAYVMARYLHQGAFKVSVIVLSDLHRISGDALINLDIIRRLGIRVLEAPGPEAWDQCRPLISTCDYIVDGILGTGLKSPVMGFYREVIEKINASRKPIMAVDIPSGLNADTGQIMGTAVRADLTVTFGFPKVGQVLFPGADLVGRLARVDIGIPDAVAERVTARYRMIEADDFRHFHESERRDVHKGERGHLLVLAGSTGKTGAAAMTSLGALRAGAGLVTLGIPRSLNPVLEAKLTEAMTYPLPETPDGTLSLEAEKEIKGLMAGKTALALGPGLSTHPETAALVRKILASCPLPMVIDADGLNALSEDVGVLKGCRGKVVLTPHPGEMGRLAGVESARVQGDRLGTAAAFTETYGCLLVLKGARTLVAEPQGVIHVNPTGNPALASGGSGDVLTGMIGGFLARRWPLSQASLAGVYLHGLAADALAEEMGQTGILPSELLSVLPLLTSSLARGKWPLETPPPEEDFCHPL